MKTTDVTANYYMIAVAFLPLAWVTLRDEHVTADIFVRTLGRRPQLVIGVLTGLLIIAYVTAFVWQSWISALSKTKHGEVWEIFGGFVPIWTTRLFLPIAGATMLLAMVFRLIARLPHRSTVTGEEL